MILDETAGVSCGGRWWVRLGACLGGIAALAVVPATAGEVQVDRTFGDHMVLQRDMPVPVWGTGTPGDKLTVAFRGQEKTGVVDAAGKWLVRLDPLAVGEPGELRVSATNTVKFQDVLVGEVWLGSGQSNMGLTVNEAKGGDPVLAAAMTSAYPRIRHLTTGGEAPAWLESKPENIGGFSALLFAFAMELQKELDVPVGLIATGVGCSCAGHWVSQEAIDADPLIKELRSVAGQQEVGTWVGSRRHTKRLGGLGCFYESRIRPVVPYAIRGVVWDQGECGTAIRGTTFWEMDAPAFMGILMRSWRAAWGQGDFPFICVQKPSGPGCGWSYDDPVTRFARPFAPLPEAVPETGNGDYGWPGGSNAKWNHDYLEIRRLPRAAIATCSDLGPGLHPANKWGYGARCARVALGMAYGRPVAIYGPTYAAHAVEGNKVRVRFDHVGQGLAWKHGDKLQGFAIAAEPGQWAWADATIDGDSVVVSSPAVAKPAAVRYAWGKEHPWANLFNRDGLPALPFRTDDWQ